MIDINGLDGLRAVACALVVGFHCLLYWGTLLSQSAGYQVSPSPRGCHRYLLHEALNIGLQNMQDNTELHAAVV